MAVVHHPEQLWWPDAKLRKRDAIGYYERIAPVMLPHLRDRPLTLKRHYNGPRSPFEWIKDAPPELPDWIPVSPQPAKSRGGELVRYVVADSVDALLWLVDFGCVDFHVWTARADRPDRPDYVLFDLDPAGVPFSDLVAAALLLREALDAFELESVVKTTGGEGLHVQVPIARRHTHEEAREFAQTVAAALVRASGGLVTRERSPSRRHGVFRHEDERPRTAGRLRLLASSGARSADRNTRRVERTRGRDRARCVYPDGCPWPRSRAR